MVTVKRRVSTIDEPEVHNQPSKVPKVRIAVKSPTKAMDSDNESSEDSQPTRRKSSRFVKRKNYTDPQWDSEGGEDDNYSHDDSENSGIGDQRVDTPTRQTSLTSLNRESSFELPSISQRKSSRKAGFTGVYSK